MKLKPKPKAEPESLVENEEEKKSVLNNLLPKLPLLGSSRHAAKDSKGSLDREISPAEVGLSWFTLIDTIKLESLVTA